MTASALKRRFQVRGVPEAPSQCDDFRIARSDHRFFSHHPSAEMGGAHATTTCLAKVHGVSTCQSQFRPPLGTACRSSIPIEPTVKERPLQAQPLLACRWVGDDLAGARAPAAAVPRNVGRPLGSLVHLFPGVCGQAADNLVIRIDQPKRFSAVTAASSVAAFWVKDALAVLSAQVSSPSLQTAQWNSCWQIKMKLSIMEADAQTIQQYLRFNFRILPEVTFRWKRMENPRRGSRCVERNYPGIAHGR